MAISGGERFLIATRSRYRSRETINDKPSLSLENKLKLPFTPRHGQRNACARAASDPVGSARSRVDGGKKGKKKKDRF